MFAGDREWVAVATRSGEFAFRNEERQNMRAVWTAALALAAVRADAAERNPAGKLIRPTTIRKTKREVIMNSKANGFRGIWYFNQPSGDEYVYKYSGGLGTYCAKHIPMAWYAAAVDKTFFCYGGTDADNRTLLHMVAYYDHKTGKLARPTILLDKHTDDAHDNPVINLDDQGYIWIFSSSHGKGRPSYISRSVNPYDISAFERKWTGNFSYPQPFFLPGNGFLFLHTWYEGGRSLYCMTSRDGVSWSPRRLLSRIEMGQYQVSFPRGGLVGTAFNMHPKPGGLNWRSNLYYMQSADFGATWQNVCGETLSLPLTEKRNPALVCDYEAQGLKVYMKDLNYDSQGNPVILYITSKGYEAGPENMPRTWTTAHWTGEKWDIQGHIVSDSNYDTGCLHIESDSRWRIIGPTETGPQPYNPGGEIAMWLSQDAGHSWRKARQMTAHSEFNHTYVRRPVHAAPGFYAFWADGHGRRPSPSRLYFCNRDGDVFQMPVRIDADFADPEPVPRP